MDAQEVEEVGAVARSQAALLSTCAATSEIKPFQELMIVHPAVLESPEASNATGSNGGPLSFHGVMSKLANSTDPAVVADFTESWLKSFAVEQQVNGYSVPARTGVLFDVLDETRSGWTRINGKLDMKKAPFRLIAVVNRMDLMGTGAGKPNGEARLVYGITLGNPRLMTVIFEFNLPGDKSRREWAQRWHKLAAPGVALDASFSKRLVDEVVSKFVAPENLSQLRTNERFFGFPWNLREFRLDREQGALVHTTVKQTPDFSHSGANPTRTAELLTWLNANKNDVVGNTHVIPEKFLGGDTVANVRTFGSGPNDPFRGSRWLIGNTIQPTISEELRSAFARQTCGGCHNGEVADERSSTAPFYHVDPRELLPGFESSTDGTGRLSAFVKDKELPLRKSALSALLSCKCVATYKVLSRTATGTEAAVSVRNISGQRVNSWDVAWRYAGSEKVTSAVNAVAIPQSDAKAFKFKNAAHNNFMEAGEGNTRTFKLVTSHDANTINPAPDQLVVNCQ